MRVSSEPLAAAKTSASRMSPCAFRYSKAFSAALVSSGVVIILETFEGSVTAGPSGEPRGARPRFLDERPVPAAPLGLERLRQVEVPLAGGPPPGRPPPRLTPTPALPPPP